MTGRSERGQALIELLGCVPLLLAVALVATQVLAAGVCRELAGHAAQAGAAAILQGSDPRAAARHALPGWSRDHLDIVVSGRRVSVRLAAPGVIPGMADRLASRATADAGPRG